MDRLCLQPVALILQQRQIERIAAGGGGAEVRHPQPTVGPALQADVTQYRLPQPGQPDPGGPRKLLRQHGAGAPLDSGVEHPVKGTRLVQLAQHQRHIEQAGIGGSRHGAMVATALPPANRKTGLTGRG